MSILTQQQRRYGPFLAKDHAWTEDWKQLSAAEAATFLALSLYADEHNVAYPSTSTLSELTRLSERTIRGQQGTLAKLEGKEFIEQVGEIRQSQGRPVKKWKLIGSQNMKHTAQQNMKYSAGKHEVTSYGRTNEEIDNGVAGTEPLGSVPPSAVEELRKLSLEELESIVKSKTKVYLADYCKFFGIKQYSILVNEEMFTFADQLEILIDLVIKLNSNSDLDSEFDACRHLKGLISLRNQYTTLLPSGRVTVKNSDLFRKTFAKRTNLAEYFELDIQNYKLDQSTQYIEIVKDNLGEEFLVYSHKFINEED